MGDLQFFCRRNHPPNEHTRQMNSLCRAESMNRTSILKVIFSLNVVCKVYADFDSKYILYETLLIILR